jgi:hypothetical protein
VTLTLPPDKARIAELLFATVFSTVVLIAFYALTSMNGLVLGNDPAVHLERAQLFIQTRQIPLANIGWTPPLFQILLAMLISFTGATSVIQLIFLVKACAAVISWLLVFSVYRIGSKFLGRRIGAVASVLMLLSFPMFEMNQWGGYTSVMGIAFVILLLLYLPSSVTGFGYLLVTASMAFSIVLSHQLATFVSAFIVAPVILVMLVKSRGRHLKALAALVLGGGIAFFLYYYQAVMPYLGGIIEHVFFAQRTTLYQIPAVSLNAFMVNFGFILFAGLVGVFVAFFSLRKQKRLTLWLILFLGLAVPFVLAESYVFGLLLPFQWFVYYLMPPLAVFAAFFVILSLDRISEFYHKYSRRWQRYKIRTVAVALVILLATLLLVRMETVYNKIGEAGVFYSTSDIKGYDAGLWLNENYPGEATTVVTEVPGTWFQVFSGKNVTAATDPLVERNLMAEAVLNLAYELQNPQTLLTGFGAKGDFTDETSVKINDLWERVSFSSAAGDFLSYNDESGAYIFKNLSSLIRSVGFSDDQPPRLTTNYTDGAVSVFETIAFHNDSYPIDIDWSLLATREITNVTLYLTASFDLAFNFDKTYLPGLLSWQNPWDSPTFIEQSNWATTEFNATTLTDSYLGVYDEQNSVTYALRFDVAPEWGSIGALSSRQIDALRFQYRFEEIAPSQPASFGYQIVTFSSSSNPSAQAFPDVKNLFAMKVNTFEVESRNYEDFIRENDVKFVVYDKNQLDTKLANSKLLELIYSNNRYVIFKIRESQ